MRERQPGAAGAARTQRASMKRKITVSILLMAGFLALGAGIALVLVKTEPVAETTQPVRLPLVVKTVKLEPQTVVEPIVGYGTARADRYARLSAQVTGEIVELPDSLKPGVEVKKGDLLLGIDQRDYAQSLQRAESLLAEARAQIEQLEVQRKNLDRLIETAGRQVESTEWEFNRVKKLFEEGSAPKREYEQMRFVHEQARLALQRLENEKSLLPTTRAQLAARSRNHEAEIEIAQLDLQRCRVTAPFDGQVDAVQVELGERVQVGLPLLSLLDPQLIEVPIELPVAVRSRVRVGAACRLSVDTVSDVSWSGRIRRIAPTASESTRSFELYIEVKNSEGPAPLVPGYFVRAVIDGPTLADVLVVPRGAVQRGRVFVYEKGKASERDVRVERHLVDQSVVTGLQPGEMVITSNLDVLYEGAPVRLENGAPEPMEAAASQAPPYGSIETK